MYHNGSLRRRKYETIMRPYVVLYRDWHDLGTCSPEIICTGGHCDPVFDMWLSFILWKISTIKKGHLSIIR